MSDYVPVVKKAKQMDEELMVADRPAENADLTAAVGAKDRETNRDETIEATTEEVNMKETKAGGPADERRKEDKGENCGKSILSDPEKESMKATRKSNEKGVATTDGKTATDGKTKVGSSSSHAIMDILNKKSAKGAHAFVSVAACQATFSKHFVIKAADAKGISTTDGLSTTTDGDAMTATDKEANDGVLEIEASDTEKPQETLTPLTGSTVHEEAIKNQLLTQCTPKKPARDLNELQVVALNGQQALITKIEEFLDGYRKILVILADGSDDFIHCPGDHQFDLITSCCRALVIENVFERNREMLATMRELSGRTSCDVPVVDTVLFKKMKSKVKTCTGKKECPIVHMVTTNLSQWFVGYGEMTSSISVTSYRCPITNPEEKQSS